MILSLKNAKKSMNKGLWVDLLDLFFYFYKNYYCEKTFCSIICHCFCTISFGSGPQAQIHVFEVRHWQNIPATRQYNVQYRKA